MIRILTLFFAICVAGIFSARAQVVNFNGYYHQDFDTLENNGTTGDSMPNGWYFYENSTTAGPTTYVIESGTGTSGNTYSYGAAGSSDRALGTLASGSNQPIIGVAFKNTTGRTVDTIRIVFKVEQWRLGQKSSGTTSRPLDSMLAEINPTATSLNSAGIIPWERLRALNLYTVDTTGTTGAVNGNSTKYSAIVDQTFTGMKIPNGTTVWLRWSDPNISGSDDGLAIDSFTMEIPVPPAPMVEFANTSATVEEGDSVQVTLSIQNENTNATTVKVNVLSNSTATVTDDYVYTTGTTYSFNASSNSDVTFWIKTVDDAKVEKTETLRLMLSDATNGAMLGDSIYVLSITDNDTTQTYKIRDVKFPQTAGVPDTTKYGFFHGVVISPDFDGGNGIQFSLEDSTGAIAVANPFINLGYSVSMGDSLIVRGKVSSLYYSTFILADSIWVKNSGNTIPAASVTTTLNDNNESDLVTVKNLKLTNKAQWNPVVGSGGFYVTATNGSKTFDIFIDENTNLFNRTAPAFQFDITGIVIQVGFTPTTGYGIIPRFNADLVELNYPTYKIAELKTVNSSGVPDSLNVRAWVKGIVQSPTYRSNALEFSLQDSTGGIIIFHASRTFGYTPNVGDSVMILGGIVNFNGLTELTLQNYDTLIVLSTGGFPITAETVTEFTEENEGSLVRLENVTIINPAQWTGSGSGFNVEVTNGTDTFIMRIDNNVDLFTAAAPTGRFNVTGVITQFDNSAPYTTGYQLLPRSTNDIELIVIPEPVFMEYTIAELKGVNANGEADSIGVKAWIRGVVYSPAFDNEFFAMADNTAGISISLDSFSYNATRGDSIRVLGTIIQVDGLTMMVADTLIVLNGGNNLQGATVITTATEANESKLVQVNNLIYAGRTGDLINFTNGTNTFSVWVANNVDLPEIDTATRINLRGILVQMDSSSPYLSDYVVLPRDSFDLDILVSVNEISKNALNFNVYPNPTNNVVNIASDFVADRIMITDVAGKEVMHTIPVTNAVRMDVTNLKAGIYFIRVQKGGNITTQKLYKH